MCKILSNYLYHSVPAWKFDENPQPQQVSATAIQVGAWTQRITAQSGWIAWTLYLIPSITPTSLKTFFCYTLKAIFQEGIEGLAVSLLLPWRCHPPKLWQLQPLSEMPQERLSLQQATKPLLERPLNGFLFAQKGGCLVQFLHWAEENQWEEAALSYKLQ